MPGQHERALEALHRRGRLRSLQLPRGTDFTSNDYLGLAHELKQALANYTESGGTGRTAIDQAASGARYSVQPVWNTMLARWAEGQQQTLGAYDRPWR